MSSPFNRDLNALIGEYDIPPGKSTAEAQELVNDLLDNTGKNRLYEGITGTVDKKEARQAFIAHIKSIYDQIEEFKDDTKERNKNPEHYAKKFESLFISSPKTKNLYLAAVREEKIARPFEMLFFSNLVRNTEIKNGLRS